MNETPREELHRRVDALPDDLLRTAIDRLDALAAGRDAVSDATAWATRLLEAARDSRDAVDDLLTVAGAALRRGVRRLCERWRGRGRDAHDAGAAIP